MNVRAETHLSADFRTRNARLSLVKTREHFLGIVSDGRNNTHSRNHNPPHDHLADSFQARALLHGDDEDFAGHGPVHFVSEPFRQPSERSECKDDPIPEVSS